MTSPDFSRRPNNEPRPNRDGYVLVLLALLLFAIMAMAALVIDLGYARLAQRKMQTATDAAALEGLWFRDVATEIQRRQNASILVANLFDDDLNPESDERNFGTGPVVHFVETDGKGIHANEFIYSSDNQPREPGIGSLPSPPVCKPQRDEGILGLSLNIDNWLEGDMVAGSNYDPNANHGENTLYQRQDFAVSGQANDVFLVRMRRTGESILPEVGASCPPLPHLFSRGALLFDQRQPLDPRGWIGNGIRVRATSIAAAKPAVRVGSPIPGRPSILPLAVSIDDWDGSPAVADAMPISLEDGLRIGDSISIGNQGLSLEGIASGYCAIYARFTTTDGDGSSPVYRVIGFGWIGAAAPAPKATGIVAWGNATSRLTDAWSALHDLPQADQDQVLDHHRNLRFPLLAPVLVR